MSERLILAIETSCDETAASVYSSTRGVCSSVVFSQIALHKQFGGVVPEIASRSHLQKISIVAQQALTDAQLSLEKIDAFGVVNRPGLPGSLLVGVCFAKALALCKNKPLIAVNHLEAHIFSSFLEHDVPFPHLCLLASGGHTGLYLVHGFGDYQLMGRTLDDAAGEAFDKVAKVIQLPYPGGPELEHLAAQVNYHDFLHYPRNKQKTVDFSFSGLKTAILYDLVARGFYNLKERQLCASLSIHEKQQVASSLLNCVADIFIDKILCAYNAHPTIKALTFVGGVACNTFLRAQLTAWGQLHGLVLYTPAARYCTDNAAMVALVAYYQLQAGNCAGLQLDIEY